MFEFLTAKIIFVQRVTNSCLDWGRLSIPWIPYISGYKSENGFSRINRIIHRRGYSGSGERSPTIHLDQVHKLLFIETKRERKIRLSIRDYENYQTESLSGNQFGSSKLRFCVRKFLSFLLVKFGWNARNTIARKWFYNTKGYVRSKGTLWQ